jgi:hypothetical protein
MNNAIKVTGCLLAVAALVATPKLAPADSTHIATGPVTSWSYGWMPAPGGTFAPMEGGRMYHGMPAWSRATLYPIVAFNNSLNDPPKGQGLGNFRVPRNRILLVPGQAGELAVVRWAAPEGGRYLVQGLFDALETCVSSNVHILKGATSLFTATVAGAQRHTFSVELSLHANETVDFGSDYGPNGNINCDVVGLSAMITML